jgi:GDP-L-fucose synthase
MPTNLYGENDNFDLESSHVIPAILRKTYEAKVSNSKFVNLWGSGNPRREFMSSDDLADAVIFLSKNKPSYDLINIGVGYDITLKELAEKIKKTVGFDGEFLWNTDIPDGPPQKLMNSQRVFDMGWEPKISLDKGLSNLYEWYIKK